MAWGYRSAADLDGDDSEPKDHSRVRDASNSPDTSPPMGVEAFDFEGLGAASSLYGDGRSARTAKELDGLERSAVNPAVSGGGPGGKGDLGDVAGLENRWPDSLYRGGTPAGKPAKVKVQHKVRNRVLLGMFGLVGGTGAMFGPSIVGTLGMIQFEEMLNQHFGSGLQSIVSRRVNKIWYKQINENNRTPGVKGLCRTLKVACRYSGMSDRAIRNLERRTGMKVEVDDSRFHVPGRHAVRSVTMPGGETLDAAGFARRLASGDPELRQLMRAAMKPALAIWVNAKMKTLFGKLGIDKLGGLIKERTVGAAMERLANRQRGSPVELDVDSRKTPVDEDTPDSQKEINQAKNSRAQGLLSEITGNVEGIDPKGATMSAAKSTPRSVASSIGKGVMITGFVDTACTAINMVSMAGYLNKLIGAEQLARFGMTYLSSVSGLKAGAATTAGWQALGEMLNTPDANGQTAFQAFGYGMISGGLWADPTDTMEFRTGGGLVGDFVSFKDMLVNAISGGDAQAVRDTCGFIQNPFVRIGSAVVGIAAAIFSGGSVPLTQIGISMAINVGLNTVLSFIVPVAVRAAAGELVPADVHGGQAGNALASAGGVLFGQNANAQGASVMTKAQAMAFDSEVRQPYLAELTADERATANPFDIYDPYSLLGSIASTIVPYLSGSLTSNLTSLAALAINPFRLLTSKVSAYSQADYYEVCQDSDYVDLGIATDPFCNPVYGLSNELLSVDPDSVVEQMYGGGYIDGDGVPQGLYAEFLETCTNNTNPIGFTNEDTGDYVRPNYCIQGYEKKQPTDHDPYPGIFYVYTIDDSVYQMMQCLMEDDESACYTEGGGQPAPAAPSGTCAPNTNLLGKYDNAHIDGKQVSVTLCELTSIKLSEAGFYTDQDPEIFRKRPDGTAITGVVVNADVSERFQAMGEAALADNPSIQLSGKGIRSFEKQQYFWNCYQTGACNNGNTAARPGTSAHESGTAIDFAAGSIPWLQRRAKEFGFCATVSDENWHYSPSASKTCYFGSG